MKKKKKIMGEILTPTITITKKVKKFNKLENLLEILNSPQCGCLDVHSFNTSLGGHQHGQVINDADDDIFKCLFC